MFKKPIWITTLLAILGGIGSRPLLAAETQDKSKESASGDSGKEIALVDVAPELYWQIIRYPKFYGDPNTTHGGPVLTKRPDGDISGT